MAAAAAAAAAATTRGNNYYTYTGLASSTLVEHRRRVALKPRSHRAAHGKVATHALRATHAECLRNYTQAACDALNLTHNTPTFSA